MGLLDHQGLKGLRAIKDIGEKQHDFFASVFPIEEVGEIPTTNTCFPGNKDEELSENEVTEEDMQEKNGCIQMRYVCMVRWCLRSPV